EGSAETIENAAITAFFAYQIWRLMPAGEDIEKVASDDNKLSYEIDLPRAQAILIQCNMRFPRSRVVTAARLPSDRGDRDLMCLMVVNSLYDMTGSHYLQDDPLRKRIVAYRDALNARVGQAVALGAKTFGERAKRQLFASLDLGDSLAVARACGL
ncbi:MAG: hypothetical protein ABW182_13690, partial [Sphingomonas sp.]